MNKVKFFIAVYSVIIVGLFFYSYTQVDLSLTLSRVSVWQTIEKAFQYIGYFNRPLSTLLYLIILLLLFGSYIGFFLLSIAKKISSKTIWILIILTVFLLTFSYNAFSYDLFNYIFDAKIVTYYHLDPYLHKALDFPHDPMLSFMHWTQRTYPYGPLWLFLTVPLSFIGFQFFLPTLFLFKLLISSCVIGTAYVIEKIMKRIDSENSLSAVVLFAFNPLVIIEGLVSAHNDMVMIFLATLALYLLIVNKFVRSFLLLILSILTKYATIMLIPLFSWIWILERQNKKIDWNLLLTIGTGVMVIPVIAASVRTNFQPWYFLYVLPFAALTGRKYYILIPLTTFAFFSLLEYAPFLFKGDWNAPIPGILTSLTTIGIILSILLTGFVFVMSLLVEKRRRATIQ